jgi:hypothetical protein
MIASELLKVRLRIVLVGCWRYKYLTQIFTLATQKDAQLRILYNRLA